MKARIVFSNNEILELKEGDQLIPIALIVDLGEPFCSMDKAVVLNMHIHNGLIPSILDVLCNYEYFYLNFNYDIAYSTNSIVKVEQV